MDKETDFLVNSLADIQNTIRALDAKFFGTIALFLLPLTEIGTIAEAFKILYFQNSFLTTILFIILNVLWFFGLLISFVGIYSVTNPIKSIKGVTEAKTKGLFYQPDIFAFNVISQFFPKAVKSRKNILEFIEDLKINSDVIFKELAFEQIKLVFIRDIKIARQKSSTILLLLTLLILYVLLVLSNIFPDYVKN